MLPKAGREKWSSLEFSLDPTASILARKVPFEEHEHEWARTCFWFSCKSSFVWTIPFSCLLKLTRRKECFEQSHCLNSVYVLNCCDHGDRNVFLLHQLNYVHIFFVICVCICCIRGWRCEWAECEGVRHLFERNMRPSLCTALKKLKNILLTASPESSFYMDSQGKKTQQFLAHREFVSSLKWMWFEWDPETLNWAQGLHSCNSRLVQLSDFWLRSGCEWKTQIPDRRNTHPQEKNKLVIGYVVAHVNSSWSSWGPVWVQWPSAKGCVQISLENRLPLLGSPKIVFHSKG